MIAKSREGLEGAFGLTSARGIKANLKKYYCYPENLFSERTEKLAGWMPCLRSMSEITGVVSRFVWYRNVPMEISANKLRVRPPRHSLMWSIISVQHFCIGLAIINIPLHGQCFLRLLLSQPHLCCTNSWKRSSHPHHWKKLLRVNSMISRPIKRSNA